MERNVIGPALGGEHGKSNGRPSDAFVPLIYVAKGLATRVRHSRITGLLKSSQSARRNRAGSRKYDRKRVEQHDLEREYSERDAVALGQLPTREQNSPLGSL